MTKHKPSPYSTGYCTCGWRPRSHRLRSSASAIQDLEQHLVMNGGAVRVHLAMGGTRVVIVP